MSVGQRGWWVCWWALSQLGEDSGSAPVGSLQTSLLNDPGSDLPGGDAGEVTRVVHCGSQDVKFWSAGNHLSAEPALMKSSVGSVDKM